ncbi:MAG: hypothetical protein WCJ29_01845 [bacterium]
MLSPQADLLLHAIRQDEDVKSSGEAPFIHVSDAISTATSIYEKARNFIDFKAEHLLRKSAIDRILTRRIKFLGQRENLGNDITRELIRLRYLPNDGVPEVMLARVNTVVLKYLAVIDLLGGDFNDRTEWLLKMCAVELEELFEPNFVEHALVQTLYEKVRPHIDTPGIPEVTRDFQIYIASYKSLTKSDAAMTEYHLLRIYVPEWIAGEVVVDKSMAETLLRARDAIIEQLTYPLQKRLLNQVKKVVAPFLLLHDLIKEQGTSLEHLVHNRRDFDEAISSLISRKYKQNADRLWRRGVRALIYVFLTKMVVGLMLELPYDFFIMKQISYLPLAANLLFPPFLLFIILVSLQMPGKSNTKVLSMAMREIVYEDEPKAVFSGVKKLSIRKKQGFAFWLYTTFYVVLWIFSFGALAGFLTKTLHFNGVSTTLFLLFTSIISFFGVSLRQNAKELIIVSGKEGLITTVFNALTLPILTLGRWISENINRVNVFLFILDILIEAPFQFIMEALESWFDFLREKKEEM